VLFAAATRLGAILAGLEPAREEALARYGRELGMAFQIADDLLDYVADASATGKNAGDDLAEGKPTLPVIRALAVAPEAQRATIRAALEHGAVDRLPEILAAVRDCGALDYARAAATRHAQSALASLDGLAPSPWRDALATLADYSVRRDR
jgi:octaprenyl-diphosphate synthase